MAQIPGWGRSATLTASQVTILRSGDTNVDVHRSHAIPPGCCYIFKLMTQVVPGLSFSGITSHTASEDGIRKLDYWGGEVLPSDKRY
jgi:hypothetical protein